MTFSLRSLLVIMLGAALAVGGWQAAIAPYERQTEIITSLNDAGATVGTRPAGPAWLRRFLDPESARTVVGVICTDPAATEVFVERAHLLPDLQNLHVTGWKFGDAELARLAANGRLRQLSLDSTSVSAQGLAKLRQARPGLAVLRSDNFARAAVENALAGSQRLTYDSDNNITGVYLRGAAVTDQQLAPLRGLHKLRWLDLSSNSITDDAVDELRRLVNLESLDLRSTALTDEAVAELRASLPECEIIHDADRK